MADRPYRSGLGMMGSYIVSIETGKDANASPHACIAKLLWPLKPETR